MQTIHKYLKPGGLFILKPWYFTPDFKEYIPQLLTVDRPVSFIIILILTRILGNKTF